MRYFRGLFKDLSLHAGREEKKINSIKLKSKENNQHTYEGKITLSIFSLIFFSYFFLGPSVLSKYLKHEGKLSASLTIIGFVGVISFVIFSTTKRFCIRVEFVTVVRVTVAIVTSTSSGPTAATRVTAAATIGRSATSISRHLRSEVETDFKFMLQVSFWKYKM